MKVGWYESVMEGLASFQLIMWRFINDKGKSGAGANPSRSTAINTTDSLAHFCWLQITLQTVDNCWYLVCLGEWVLPFRLSKTQPNIRLRLDTVTTAKPPTPPHKLCAVGPGGLRAPCVLACAMRSLAIVITIVQSFFSSFFFSFSVFCFWPTSGNLPCAK